MIATLEQPLRARAALRAGMYMRRTRASQIPLYHPQRLQLEEEFADLGVQLTEVEQIIGAFRRSKPPRPAAPTEIRFIADLHRVPQPVSVADSVTRHTRDESTSPALREKREPHAAGGISAGASSAARRGRAAIQLLHRASAIAAHAVAGVSSFLQRTLDVLRESALARLEIARRALERSIGNLRSTFGHFAIVAQRKCRDAGIWWEESLTVGSALLRLSTETWDTNRKVFDRFVSVWLGRFADRIRAVLGSCAFAAAKLRRVTSSGTSQCMTAGASLLRGFEQLVSTTSMKLWRMSQGTWIRTSDQIRAVVRNIRAVTDQEARRAYADATQGFARRQRLVLQKVVQRGSDWTRFARGVVVFRVREGIGAATEAGQWAAEHAGDEASRSLIAGRLAMQETLTAARIAGERILIFCRYLLLRATDRALKALATLRPAIILTLQSARTKWTRLGYDALVARAAVERWAAPKLQQSRKRAKSSAVSGRLFLSEVIVAADIKVGMLMTFARRLSRRVSDRAGQVLAVSRPATKLVLRTAQSTTLRSAAQCQQIALRSLEMARAKCADLYNHATVAGDAMERRFSPKLEEASVKAKRRIVAIGLVLQQIMIAAHVRTGTVLMFCRRLPPRISDRIKRSTRHRRA